MQNRSGRFFSQIKSFAKRNHIFWLFCLACAILLISGIEAEANTVRFYDTLTEQEREYIEEDNLITVAFSPNKGPIQYRDSDGEQKGISRDVLEKAASVTGIRFSFVTMDGMQVMREAVDSGQVQILAGIPVENAVKELYDVEFSLPYLEADYGVLLKRGGSLDDRSKLKLALTVGLDVPEEFKDVQSVIRYDTIQECIEAVNDGSVDFTYGNAYVLEFYSQGYSYQKLSVVPFSGDNQQICFGVTQRADARISSILDKFIRYMDESEFTNIIVRNVAVSTQTESLASWMSLYPRVGMSIVVIIVILLMLLTAFIINGNKRKATLLRVEHQRYLLLSEVAHEYFYEYNFQTDTLSLSNETAALFGTKTVFRKWLSVFRETDMLDTADRKMLEQLYEVCMSDVQPNAATFTRGMEVALPVAGGEKRWFRLTRAILYQQGRAAYSIGKLLDIEEEHKAYNELIKKSVTDGLTGLYNGVTAKELIERSAQSMREGTFFMMDIDFFKSVNDSCGHQAGDRVIQELAEILRCTFRKDDIIGRVGGDEFIVFALNVSDRMFIEKKCQDLQSAVGNIKIDADIRLSVSIGVTVMQPPCHYEQLFQQADAALYFVKNNGRRGYHIFN